MAQASGWPRLPMSLSAAGMCGFTAGRIEDGIRYGEQAVGLADDAAFVFEPDGREWSNLAANYMLDGRMEDAHRTALELLRRTGDPLVMARCTLLWLGKSTLSEGDEVVRAARASAVAVRPRLRANGARLPAIGNRTCRAARRDLDEALERGPAVRLLVADRCGRRNAWLGRGHRWADRRRAHPLARIARHLRSNAQPATPAEHPRPYRAGARPCRRRGERVAVEWSGSADRRPADVGHARTDRDHGGARCRPAHVRRRSLVAPGGRHAGPHGHRSLALCRGPRMQPRPWDHVGDPAPLVDVGDASRIVPGVHHVTASWPRRLGGRR